MHILSLYLNKTKTNYIMAKTGSYLQDLNFNEDKVAVSLILDTEFTKEIRIAFKKGQVMREHQAPLPIVVQVFRGEIDFGVGEERYNLKEGDMITLAGTIKHDLIALEESVVRLTLSKGDKFERVQSV